MDLNNENFRASLVAIYGIEQKYIQLKQGNWYNPQSLTEKPTTWIGYKILRNEPISLPDYQEDTTTILGEETDNEYVEVTKIAEIDLQFIGVLSEQLANNVAFWLKRQDVKDQLTLFNGQLMAKDMVAWSSDYYLDGENTITAWNVKIFIAWVHQVITNQSKFTSVSIEGGVNG